MENKEDAKIFILLIFSSREKYYYKGKRNAKFERERERWTEQTEMNLSGPK